MKEDFAVLVKVRSAFMRDKLASRMSFCIMTHIFWMIFLHRSCNFHCHQVNGFHVETPKSTKYGQHSIGWQYASKMTERQFSTCTFCRDIYSLKKGSKFHEHDLCFEDLLWYHFMNDVSNLTAKVARNGILNAVNCKNPFTWAFNWRIRNDCFWRICFIAL